MVLLLGEGPALTQAGMLSDVLSSCARYAHRALMCDCACKPRLGLVLMGASLALQGELFCSFQPFRQEQHDSRSAIRSADRAPVIQAGRTRRDRPDRAAEGGGSLQTYLRQ